MHISIKRTTEEINKDFGEFLIVKIKELLLLNINEPRLILLNNYINNEIIAFKSIYRKHISAQEIILLGLQHLKVSESPTNILISINSNIFIPGYDRIKLLDACKLINYGNSEIKGYPIFTNTFTKIVNEIDDYYNEYLEG